MKPTNEMKIIMMHAHQQMGADCKMNDLGTLVLSRDNTLRYCFRIIFNSALEDTGEFDLKNTASNLHEEVCNWLNLENGSLYVAERLRRKILKLQNLEHWI